MTSSKSIQTNQHKLLTYCGVVSDLQVTHLVQNQFSVLSAHPKTACAFTILPNVGSRGDKSSYASVREKHQEIETEIQATFGAGVSVRVVVLVIRPKASSGRPAKSNCGYYALMWLINGSLWEDSLLWSRMAIPDLQEVPRSQMVAPMAGTVGAEVRFCEEMVLTQALTSETNYWSITEKLVEEIDWNKYNIKNLQFIDYIPCDNAMNRMVVANLGPKRIENLPSPNDPYRSLSNLSISSMLEPKRNAQVSKFVDHASLNFMRHQVMSGNISLPNFSKKDPPTAEALAPLKADSFKLLVPCMEDDPPSLRLPRRLYDEWTTSSMKENFLKLVEDHNKEYAIDGKLHPPDNQKRSAAAAGIAGGGDAPPIPKVGSNEPDTVEAMNSTYGDAVKSFALGDPSFSLAATTTDNKFYICNIGTTDGILASGSNLGVTGRGEWVVDAKANDLLDAGGAKVLVWEMNSDTHDVSFTSDPLLKEVLPESPTPLWKVLRALQLSGHTSSEFVAHSFKRLDAPGGGREKFNVSCTQKCLFRSLPSDRTKALALSNVWNKAPFEQLLQSHTLRVVVKIRYQASSNQVAPVRPAIYTKVPIRLQKGGCARVF